MQQEIFSGILNIVQRTTKFFIPLTLPRHFLKCLTRHTVYIYLLFNLSYCNIAPDESGKESQNT